jgi:hypothetical protein
MDLLRPQVVADVAAELVDHVVHDLLGLFGIDRPEQLLHLRLEHLAVHQMSLHRRGEGTNDVPVLLEQDAGPRKVPLPFKEHRDGDLVRDAADEPAQQHLQHQVPMRKGRAGQRQHDRDHQQGEDKRDDPASDAVRQSGVSHIHTAPALVLRSSPLHKLLSL